MRIAAYDKRIELPPYVAVVLDLLTCAGHAAYAVGGGVRDFIIGRAADDWDVASSASPDEVIALFSGYKTIAVGKKYGTVAVVTEGGTVEITAFRSESGYYDSRHPSRVEAAASLECDVIRRDFTINAIACDKDGRIFDYVGGIDDINARIIRTVGDADKRFSEDSLRIMRALRFAAALGFEIEADTKRALFENAYRLCGISRERIFAELKKLLVCEFAPYVIGEFAEVFGIIIDSLSTEKLAKNAKGMGRLNADSTLRLAYISADCENPRAALASLKSDNKTARAVLNALTACSILRQSSGISEIKKIILKYGREALYAAADILSARGEAGDGLRSAIEEAGEPVTRQSLAVSAEELMALGYRGRALGEVLDFLICAVNSGRAENEKQKLIETMNNNTTPSKN